MHCKQDNGYHCRTARIKNHYSIISTRTRIWNHRDARFVLSGTHETVNKLTVHGLGRVQACGLDTHEHQE